MLRSVYLLLTQQTNSRKGNAKFMQSKNDRGSLDKIIKQKLAIWAGIISVSAIATVV